MQLGSDREKQYLTSCRVCVWERKRKTSAVKKKREQLLTEWSASALRRRGRSFFFALAKDGNFCDWEHQLHPANHKVWIRELEGRAERGTALGRLTGRSAFAAPRKQIRPTTAVTSSHRHARNLWLPPTERVRVPVVSGSVAFGQRAGSSISSWAINGARSLTLPITRARGPLQRALLGGAGAD